MDYRYLGRTGLKVSDLCFGAMTFGREADKTTSFQMLDAFNDAGGTFIDTANVYGTGTSETILGEWLANQPRDDFVIATKVRFSMGDGPNDSGLGRKHIMQQIDASLARLQTDYVDLYQVHCRDENTPLEETLGTLHRLVESGKVRYIGVSNFKAYQIQKAVDISRANGWEPFISLQPLYNLLDRSLEWEIVELCQREGLGIIPWSPLRGGWLTGKYSRENPPEGDTRIAKADEKGWMEKWDNYNTERTWAILDVLEAVADECEKSMAQVALNWVKDAPGVTAPIIGARNLSQLTENLGATGWHLSDEQRQRLNDISHMPGPYPYDFINEVTG
jgi:aryl-alcohol dehydrogenase-like predicted oxidoreductase